MAPKTSSTSVTNGTADTQAQPAGDKPQADSAASPAAAGTGSAGAVPRSAVDPSAPALPVDEYYGQGGEYEIGADGVRRLVSRTDWTPPAA